MKNLPQIFNYKGVEVRTIIDENGKPWFVANDVAKILGYEKPNNAIHMHCKKFNKINCPELGYIIPINVIPESDIYRLVMRSNLPEAEKFQNWVVEVVLPAIRKTGQYSNQPMSMIDMIIQSALEMKRIDETQQKHGKRLAILEAKSHQNSGDFGYFTILAFCKLKGITPSLPQAAKLGKRAAEISRNLGIEIHTIRDQRFGTVNSYHEDILNSVFEEIKKNRARLVKRKMEKF